MHQDYSFWEYETYNQLWDVCIIGSGICGISTGISLLEKNPQCRVAVIDRWFIPLGASTRNAGFSCFGSPSEILQDIANMGEQAAMDLVKKRWLGLQKLQARLDLQYARYETLGGYELYHPEEFEPVREKLDYLNGLLESITNRKTVFAESQIPAGITGFSNMIYNPLEGQLHPGFMMENLRSLFESKGGKVITGLNIEEIHDEGSHVQLQHKMAVPIKAKKVVVTTNAFALKLIPDLDVHGARNHVFVTSPIEGLPWKGCYHYDRGYYYFRNIGNRILLGGARNTDLQRENTAEFGFNPIVVEHLEHFLYTHLTSRSHSTIDFRWSGIIDVGSQKSPIIKAVSPNVFAGVRLSGMGIALASLMGEELTQLVLQHD